MNLVKASHKFLERMKPIMGSGIADSSRLNFRNKGLPVADESFFRNGGNGGFRPNPLLEMVQVLRKSLNLPADNSPKTWRECFKAIKA